MAPAQRARRWRIPPGPDHVVITDSMPARRTVAERLALSIRNSEASMSRCARGGVIDPPEEFIVGEVNSAARAPVSGAEQESPPAAEEISPADEVAADHGARWAGLRPADRDGHPSRGAW